MPSKYAARFRKGRTEQAWAGMGQGLGLEPRRRLKEARGPAFEPNPGATELCTPQRGRAS